MQSSTDSTTTTSATVLSRALSSKSGSFTAAGARFILDLGITAKDKRRLLKLLAKQRERGISTKEHDELESYIQADNILSIFRARAILALQTAGDEP
jgi:hypothetical protein